jgi:hypothetical protein
LNRCGLRWDMCTIQRTYTPMFSLFRLPTELVVLLLRDWIDMAFLGRLDSAACSHEVRSLYADIVRSVSFVRESMNEVLSLQHWEWLAKRGIRTRTWDLTCDVPAALLLNLSTRTGGDHLRTLVLGHIDRETAKNFHVVYQSCTRIADLEVCRCWHWPRLLPTSGAGDNLRTLSIKDCDGATAATFSKNQFPSLESLYMQGRDNPSAVTSLFSAAPNLRDVRLRYSSVADCGLNTLQNHADQLHTLVLDECHALTTVGVASLAERCVNLTCLDLTHYEQLGDVAAQSFVANCPRLTTVKLGGTFTEASVIDLATQRGATLQHLSLVSLTLRSDAGLLAVAKTCSKLVELNVDSCDSVTAEVLVRLVSSLRCLRALSLQSCDVVTDTVLTAVAKNLRDLRTLSLYDSTGYTKVGALIVIRYLPRLKTFAVARNHALFSDVACALWIERMPGLEVWEAEILLPQFKTLADW